MATTEAITIARNGIDPLAYRIDPKAERYMGQYKLGLEAVIGTLDYRALMNPYNQSHRTTREKGLFLAAVGETLWTADLPHTYLVLRPDPKSVGPDRGFAITQTGTFLGAAVQNRLRDAAQVYTSELAKTPSYTNERRKELVDEFVVRCVNKVKPILTSAGLVSKGEGVWVLPHR